MKIFFQTLFFFLLVTQICFAQWYKQNSPTTQNLNSVTFIDVNKGFAVGDSGTILFTSNGGNDWIKQSTGTTVNLSKIFAVNDSICWAVGDSIILNTSDAGISWNMIATGSLNSLSSILFIDSNTGWIVNESRPYPDTNIILHTSNAGQDWIQQNISWGYLRDIYFIDSNTGIIVGGENFMGTSEIILKTNDGGVTWTEKQAGSDASLRRIYFINADSGFVVGGRHSGSGRSGRGVLLRTVDAGDNWLIDSVLLNITDNFLWSSFKDLYFSNYMNGTIVGSCFSPQGAYEGIILKTSDGGQNWDQQYFQDINSFSGIFFIDTNNGWIVGNNGTILHTLNSGVTFTENEIAQPKEFLLLQNYPNPFNPSTTIKYSLPELSKVKLFIYNLLGEKVKTLIDEEKPAGSYNVEFTIQNLELSSGVYFYQLQAGSFIETKKMILIK